MDYSITIYYLFMFLSNARFSRAIWLIYLVKSGYSMTQIGALQSAYYLTKLVADVPTGGLADIFGKKKIMAIGTVVATISSGLFIMSNAFPWLILVFCLDGLAQSMQRGADNALVYSYLTEVKREDEYMKIVGRANAISCAGLALATWIGGIAFEAYKFMPFILQMFIYIVGAVLIFTFKEKHLISKKSKLNVKEQIINMRKGIYSVFKLPIIQVLIWFTVIIVAVVTVINIFSQGYFNSLGIKESNVAILFTISTGLSAIASWNAYRIGKLRLDKLIIFSSVFLLCGLIAMVSRIIPIAIVGYLLVYISLDFLDPVLNDIFNKFIDDDVRSTVLSSLNMIISLVTMICFPVAGSLTDNLGYRGLMIGIFMIFLIFIIILIGFYRKLDNVGSRSIENEKL